MAENEARAVTLRQFSAYGLPLKMVTSFKYLGRVILVADDELMTVVLNVVKARMVLWRMSKILSREGARPQVSGYFFKSVIQLVLLFGAET